MFKVFFVSVFQWIKDALLEKHLFMISGATCDWTAHGARDCGIVTAGLALRQPSFNPDRQWVVNTYAYATHNPHPCWLLQASILVRLYVYWNVLKSNPRESNWASLGRSPVSTEEKVFFKLRLFLPPLLVYLLSVPEQDQRWACAKRCHQIASPLSPFV